MRAIQSNEKTQTRPIAESRCAIWLGEYNALHKIRLENKSDAVLCFSDTANKKGDKWRLYVTYSQILDGVPS